MNWGSLSEFLHMGGYGLYVWGSYGAFALFIAIEIILVRRRSRLVRQRLARMVRAKGVEQYED